MGSDEKKEFKIAEKWGFGSAPAKRDTQNHRLEAAAIVLQLLKGSTLPESSEEILDALSTVKGLFNRVVNKDQWDWFTVAGQLGYPSRGISGVIADSLYELRKAIKNQVSQDFADTRKRLQSLPTWKCLSVFLGNLQIKEEPGAGWVYVLSTREMNQILKVGMTTRTIQERVREINRATGVAIPFGVSAFWRVSAPAKAEKLVHETLDEFRMRGDREFFKADFGVALRMLDAAIKESGLELRTLDRLAGLHETQTIEST